MRYIRIADREYFEDSNSVQRKIVAVLVTVLLSGAAGWYIGAYHIFQ